MIIYLKENPAGVSAPAGQQPSVETSGCESCGFSFNVGFGRQNASQKCQRPRALTA